MITQIHRYSLQLSGLGGLFPCNLFTKTNMLVHIQRISYWGRSTVNDSSKVYMGMCITKLKTLLTSLYLEQVNIICSCFCLLNWIDSSVPHNILVKESCHLRSKVFWVRDIRQNMWHILVSSFCFPLLLFLFWCNDLLRS